MRDELAERALAVLLGWDEPRVVALGSRLQLLARLKYDEYEGYRPGEKFLESFVALLSQLTAEERKVVVEFVLDRLIFVSKAELYHAIETVYPDVIRPTLINRTAQALGTSGLAVSQIVNSPEFQRKQRGTLVMGLSDGARLDKLRRAGELTTEQYYQGPEIAEDRIQSLLDRLQAEHPDDLFSEVFLVDDFAGSGYTLLHRTDSAWAGKLWRASEQVSEWEGRAFAKDAVVRLILYAASESALDNLKSGLEESRLAWSAQAVQVIPKDSSERSNSAMVELCKRFFDYDVLFDEHIRKGGDEPYLGFGGGALPLVLHHNTPNNSVAILWADTTLEPDSKMRRRALFPRLRRHR